MGNRIFRLSFPFITAILTAILLTLAYPRFDLGWLGWIALVPLLISSLDLRPLTAFFPALVCGIVFCTGVFSWIFDIPGYHYTHHMVLGIYLGPLFGLFGLAVSAVSRRWGIAAALFAAPFIWVTLEYIRSHFLFLALPWALLGHSQYQYLPVIQIAALTGVYGISFLLALINSALAAAILAFLPSVEKIRPPFPASLSKKAALSILVASVVAVSLVFLYGQAILSKPPGGKTIKLSVLQGNIDQEKKANPKKHARFIMQKYVELTRKAAKDRPDMIVWPEAATPGFVLKSMSLHKQLSGLIKETKIHFLIGSSEYPKFMKDRTIKMEDFGNTALFFSPQGKVLGQYLKIHLVPFGEYIPYVKTIPWPRFIVADDKRSFEIPGEEFTLFELNGSKFGAVICWEVVFPGLFRTFVKNGANFMINLTNEGWFGETAAPYQLAAINIFRAVENRTYVARAANTGISCYINPFGRIYDRVRNNNKDIYVDGYLTAEIRHSDTRTFYTLYGDVFVYIILGITFLMVALCIFRVPARIRGKSQRPQHEI